MGFSDRVQSAWNAFFNKDPTPTYSSYNTITSSYRPDRMYFTRGNERTIITAIYNRIATDCANVQIEHVRTDENGGYLETIPSTLNDALTVDANVDQTGRALVQDAVMSLLDEGCVAIVPTDTSTNPNDTASYNILELRVGKVLEWYPDKVKVQVYNERVGKKQEIVLPKRMVALVENPFYAVMNQQNSIAQRLIRKLNLLDQVDEQSGSGKLDMIIQLPYLIKTEARRVQAEKRRTDIETQLAGSKYGIAYADGTEKIMQLNRPIENNLLKTVEYLTNLLYSQLGITAEIMNGTANADVMQNYYSRTIEPILSAITDEMKRKFLTKTARTQYQSIQFRMDPFKLVPIGELATIITPLSQNAILSSNEIRGIIGRKPSEDPNADTLSNKNINPMDPTMATDQYTDTGEVAPEEEPPEDPNAPVGDIPVSELSSV